ncbi:MAG: DNA-binding response regulator [Marinilabiliales bacterium]|nr:MAG: DNA-binding response regulator [Marinilabiliales bacterium]
MRIIKCITIDDEPLALRQMATFIKKVDFLQLEKEFDNAIGALNYIKSHEVDIVFLDIEMDEFSGLDFLESLQSKPYIILTTAYDHYALKGFEYHVADYLLKPISYTAFIKSVNRIYDLISLNKNKATLTNTVQEQIHDFIFLKTEYKLQKVKFTDILYIKSMGNYMSVITQNSGTIYTIMNFKDLINLLPVEDFIRIHKSYIIPFSRINTINKSSVEINGEMIPIGESYRQLFIEYMKTRGFI